MMMINRKIQNTRTTLQKKTWTISQMKAKFESSFTLNSIQ